MIRYFSETEANNKVDLTLFVLKVVNILKVVFVVETKRGEIVAVVVFSKKQALQILENLRPLITQPAFENGQSEILNLPLLPNQTAEKIIIQRGEMARQTKKYIDSIINESIKKMANENHQLNRWWFLLAGYAS
jgi:hypothetical protein